MFLDFRFTRLYQHMISQNICNPCGSFDTKCASKYCPRDKNGRGKKFSLLWD